MTEPELRLTPYTLALAIVTVLSILSTAPQVSAQINSIASLLTTICSALLTVLFGVAAANKAIQTRAFTKSPPEPDKS